jgi:hypothetical protein
MLLWLLLLAVRRTASVMSLPTNFVTALTTPSVAPMTDWLIMFKWSASSCASNHEVMVGVIVVDDAFEAASALAYAALRTEFAVIALVDFTLVRRFVPSSSSFSMPLLGLLGLNWLMRTRRIPFCRSKIALCVYCQCLFVWRASFLIPSMTYCFVVALTM